jgi:tripartite-type tricarboxylate transporter receptor subunit TctC
VNISHRRQFLRLVAGAAALPAMLRVARAQAYPTRPITVIVPFAAGGGADAIGRIVTERMRASLGQPFVIEIVAGANGSIGVGRAVHAANDGYTLSIGNWNTHVANGVVYRLQYDLLRDFEPVALLASDPFLIVAKKATAASDLKEFITWLKANSDKVSQGSGGVGSPGHVGGILLRNTTGASFQHVPYRGDSQATQDLVAGQIDFMIAAPTASLPQVRAGAIKAYAVTSNRRFAAAAEIPTVDEAGLPGLYVSNWYALFAPKGTPKEIIGKLNAAVVDALSDPTVRVRLANQGQDIPPRGQQTPEALAGFQKAEIEKWWPIIKAANIKSE